MGDKKASKTINLKGGIVTDDSGQGDLTSLTVGYSFEYDPSSTWSQKVRKLEKMFPRCKKQKYRLMKKRVSKLPIKQTIAVFG